MNCLCRALVACLASLLPGFALVGSATTASAAEPDFPSRTIQIVVPYVAGGPVDLTARALARQLQGTLGQSVLVMNQAGASGNIGATNVVRSAPDGYTLLLTADTALTANVALFGSKMGFDPAHDLRPIATVVSYGQMLTVNPAVPARTLREFVTLGRQQDISYASAGIGAPGHLAMEQFVALTGIHAIHVPYKGTAQAVNDLLGGQVQSGFMITPGVVQHVAVGRLRALAVSSSKRSPLAPEVPTVAEAGFPEAAAEYTFVLMAPAGTPETVVRLLNTRVREALHDAAVANFLQKLDLSPVGDTPDEARERLAATTVTLARVVKLRNIRAE